MKLRKEMLPALILIDIQEGFDDEVYWGGSRNNPDAEENAKQFQPVINKSCRS
jgi:hypothetical protein